MSMNRIYKQSDKTGPETVLALIIATLVVATIGYSTGLIIATIAPANKCSWGALAFAPVWILFEIVFEMIVGMFGTHSRLARVMVTVALILSFYLAWFAVRLF